MLFLVVGTPWKRPRSSRPCCPDCDDGWFGGHIFYQNSNVTNATAKFLWERVERVLDYLDEMFTFHPSPTEINKGRLTLSVYPGVDLLFAVAFVFLFVFLAWSLSKEDIGSYRPTRRAESGHSGCILP